MRRKIIRQGHNTLTITLPSEWVKRFNLKQGDEVNLVERENGLFVSAEKQDSPSQIEIDITGLSTMLIWKHISTAYRAGYNKIIVRFKPDSVYDSPFKYFAHYIPDSHFSVKTQLSPQEFVQQISSRFVGFEAIDYGKDFCVMQEIGQSTTKEFDSSLRRIFLLLLHLSEGIIEDFSKHQTGFIGKVHMVDMQIDKFHDYCARVLNKTGFEDPYKSSLTILLIFLLELVGDEFKHLAIQVKKSGSEVNSKKIIEYLHSINKQLNIFYEMNYKYDREKLVELFKLNKTFLDYTDGKKGNHKEDVQSTIEKINRFIDALSEVLIAKQMSKA